MGLNKLIFLTFIILVLIIKIGRVQMTAAAFAKELLALEGELAPILI